MGLNIILSFMFDAQSADGLFAKHTTFISPGMYILFIKMRHFFMNKKLQTARDFAFLFFCNKQDIV